MPISPPMALITGLRRISRSMAISTPIPTATIADGFTSLVIA